MTSRGSCEQILESKEWEEDISMSNQGGLEYYVVILHAQK